LDLLGAWYDTSGKEMVSMRTFSLLMKSVGVFGLTGLDKLLSFMLVTDIKMLINKTVSCLKSSGQAAVLAQMASALHPFESVPQGGVKFYSSALSSTSKFTEFLPDSIANIGQKQLLRLQIANVLNVS